MFFLRKTAYDNLRYVVIKSTDKKILISCRPSSYTPSFYDGDKDPAPLFFSSNVQELLRRLTRPDLNKIFRRRTNKGSLALKNPKYKFLTDEQLEQAMQKANKKADSLLQMPPIIKLQKPIDEVLSKDPALIGYDKATYLFTDITFGVPNEQRIIVQRDPDGTLRNCDHPIRKKLNQIYFPIAGRKVKEPLMFTDQERLLSLLDNDKYEYVLDRACLQYEPDEPIYQNVTSITYQHVDANNNYEILRSTRHFGPLVFYLTWHHSIDHLMLELIQNSAIREAVLLIDLRQTIHKDVAIESVDQISKDIYPTQVQLSKPEKLTEEDIQLDSRCLDCVEKYISKHSLMKSQHELALQGFREFYQQLIELSRGLKKAHGNV